MENADAEEPEKKRPHLNSVSSPMARNSVIAPDNKSVSPNLSVLFFFLLPILLGFVNFSLA